MSSSTVQTIADVAARSFTSVADAVHALSAVGDRGIWSDDRLTPWSDAVRASAVRIAALRELMASSSSSPARTPHIGLLLAGTPEYLHLLGTAACSEIVVAGLNPTRRGEALLRDAALADCALILTDADNEALLDGLDPGIPVVNVDSPEWAALLDRHADAALPAVTDVPTGPDDLVALVFTSGTSGDPKAVRITQNKISVPGRMLAERFGIGTDDCVYSAMPLFHSNAVMVAWPIALFSGCSIALRRRFSASNWLDDVRRHGCTFANYVGAPLSYILATPERPDDADNPMRVVYGNEAPADVRREFARRFGVTVVDGFGSSEGGISVTRTPETPDAALGPLPAGVLVVDPETGEECPRARFDDAGVLLNADEAVGEMVADGPGLFAGYWGDPAADAERMRGGRFHSGDLAYVDDDGWIYFAGRSGGWMRVDGENLAAAPIERVPATPCRCGRGRRVRRAGGDCARRGRHRRRRGRGGGAPRVRRRQRTRRRVRRLPRRPTRPGPQAAAVAAPGHVGAPEDRELQVPGAGSHLAGDGPRRRPGLGPPRRRGGVHPRVTTSVGFMTWTPP